MPEEISHSFIPTTDHRALQYCEAVSHELMTKFTHHTQTHALITIHQVAEILAGSGNRDPLFIPQLVESALNPKIRFPILTIRYTVQTNVKSVLERSVTMNENGSPAPPAIVPSR